MRKKLFGLVSLLLAGAMMLGMLFTGCGKKSKEPSDGVPDPQKNVSSGPVTLTYLTGEHANWPISDDTPVLKEIEKRIGVKIKYMAVPSANFNSKLNIVLASKELPDMMNLDANTVNTYATKGVFVALDPYIEKQAPNLKKILTPDVKMKVINPEDLKTYCVPLVNMTPWQFTWMLRKDWLDAAGLKEPDTLDDWKKVLKAFKEKDLAGEGKTIPLVTNSLGVDTILSGLYPAYGLYPSGWTPKDGKIVLNAMTNEHKEAIAWIRDLYKEGLLDKEYAVTSNKQWEEKMVTRAGACISYATRPDMFTSQAKEKIPGYDVIPTVPPKGPHGNREISCYDSTLAQYTVTITKECKAVDAAIKYIDFMFSEEGEDLTALGIEGTHYFKKDGKKVWSDDILKSNNDFTYFAQIGIMQQMFPRRRSDLEQQLYGDKYVMCGEKQKDYLQEPFPVLSYTNEQQDIMKEYYSVVLPLVKQYNDKFIMGQLVLDDSNWEKFQSELKKVGAEKFVKIQNEAYKAYNELYEKVKNSK